MACKPTYNRGFFNTIDSESKAYFLGIMFSDGNVTYNIGNGGQQRLQLAMTDIDVLEKFKEALEYPTCHIGSQITVKSKKPIFRMLVYGREIVEDIIRNGCTPNKSHTLRYPELVPKDLERHFIRGYFDGDGGIGCFNRAGRTQRWEASISGTEDVVSRIVSIFIGNNINCNYYKHPIGRSTFEAKISRPNLVVMHDYLYRGATVYMDRKKGTFDKYINSI